MALSLLHIRSAVELPEVQLLCHKERVPRIGPAEGHRVGSIDLANHRYGVAPLERANIEIRFRNDQEPSAALGGPAGLTISLERPLKNDDPGSVLRILRLDDLSAEH